MNSTPVCPYCKGSVTLLSLVSSISVTDFYRCGQCEKVSESSKGTNIPHALETRPEVAPTPSETAWSDVSVSVSGSAFDRHFFSTGWRRAL